MGMQGVKGVSCIWRAKREFVERYKMPTSLPSTLVCPCYCPSTLGPVLLVANPVAVMQVLLGMQMWSGISWIVRLHRTLYVS